MNSKLRNKRNVTDFIGQTSDSKKFGTTYQQFYNTNITNITVTNTFFDIH